MACCCLIVHGQAQTELRGHENDVGAIHFWLGLVLAALVLAAVLVTWRRRGERTARPAWAAALAVVMLGVVSVQGYPGGARQVRARRRRPRRRRVRAVRARRPRPGGRARAGNAARARGLERARRVPRRPRPRPVPVQGGHRSRLRLPQTLPRRRDHRRAFVSNSPTRRGETRAGGRSPADAQRLDQRNDQRGGGDARSRRPPITQKAPLCRAFRDGRGGFRTCDLSRVKRALSH